MLYKRKSNIASRKIANTTVFLRSGNSLLGVNPVAGHILTILKEPTSKESILTSVAKEFNTSQNEVSADIDEFLTNCIKNEIIEKV